MADQGDPRGPIEGDYLEADPGQKKEPGQGLVTLDASIIGGLTRAEIDVQIATAHRFPRSIEKAQRMIQTLATLDIETATGCFFRKPQRVQVKNEKTGKEEWKDGHIEGPSIRFAEIAMQSWGNGRVASRVTDQTETEIEATGIFHDLESNVAWAKSVRMGITYSRGGRFPQHLVTTIGNAAAAKAVRNAIFAGIPRGIWNRGYLEALKVSKGDAKTLPQRRAALFAKAAEEGIPPEILFAMMDVKGEADITIDHLFDAGAYLTAIRDGEATADEIIARHHAPLDERGLDEAFGRQGKSQAGPAKENPKSPPPPPPPPPPATKPAPAAAAPKPTPDSAMAASAVSPAPTDSGPQEPEPESDAGEKAASEIEPTNRAENGSGKVVDFPGDRKAPTTVDELRAQREAEKAQQAEPPAQQEEGGAQQVDAAAFNAFAREVGEAKTWDELKPVARTFLASEAYGSANRELQVQALGLALDAAALWPIPEGDVTFFRLWLSRARPEEVRPAFRKVMKGEYQTLDPAAKDALVDEVNRAEGNA